MDSYKIHAKGRLVYNLKQQLNVPCLKATTKGDYSDYL
jgi:hypothetical protein